MIKMDEIKDCKTVLEEATNDLLTSEKAITKIRVKLEDNQKLTPDEIELNLAILDTQLEEIKKLKTSLLRLYRPYKEKT